MSRPVTTYKAVERGIQKVTRTYDDGRVVTKYRIKFADALGAMQFKTVNGGPKDARQALAEARTAVAKGKHVAAKDGSARFLDVANQWFDVKQSDWKQRTEGSVRWTIDSKLVDLHALKMRDLDYHRVVTLRAALSRPKANGDKPAPSSIKRTMWVLNAICDYACKRNLISENPCAKLDKIKARKPQKKMPTTEDVERLVAVLSSPTPARNDRRGRQLQERPADPRYPLLVETAAYSGLRAGELAGLQVRDLNFFNRSI